MKRVYSLTLNIKRHLHGLQKACFMFILFLCSPLCLAQLTMQISAPTISTSDTLTLILTSTNPQNQGQPNIRLIEKDFNVISTEHRVNYSFVNGVAQSNNQWIYILFPKHAGTITIPPLSLGREIANAGLTVTVKGQSAPASQATPQNMPNDTPDDVFIKTSIDSKSAYINAQILYTVKVFNRRHLLDVEYTPPEANNALVLPLDQSRHYQTTIANTIFTVEELQYAIFPNKSGELVIHPPQLKAIMYDLIPEHVQVKGQTLHVQVKPAPSNLSSFLPALNLTATEQFDPKATTFKQGETLTRTITLSAVGVPASLLPTPQFSGKNFSAYPSQPELKNEQSQQGIIGKSTIRVTYLFNQSGKQSIPSIQIPWFNTQTQQVQTTTLPAHTFSIEADKALSDTVTIPEPKDFQPIFTFSNPVTIWMSTTLVLVLILLFLLIRNLLKRPESPSAYSAHATTKHPAPVSIRTIKQKLKQACFRHDPKEVARELVLWANATWPDAQLLHLKQVSVYCQDEILSREIDRLTEVLYREVNAQPWEGKALWEAFENYINEKPQDPKQRHKSLPELNPH